MHMIESELELINKVPKFSARHCVHVSIPKRPIIQPANFELAKTLYLLDRKVWDIFLIKKL